MIRQFPPVLAALLLVAIASCTKLEEPETVQDMLRNGQWRQVSGSVRLQGHGVDTTTDYFADVPECVQDDYIVFNENFSGAMNDNAVSCGTGDPQEIPFTWEVKEAGARLNIFSAQRFFRTGSVYAEIVTISDGKLSLRYVVHDQTTPGIIDTLTYENSYSK